MSVSSVRDSMVLNACATEASFIASMSTSGRRCYLSGIYYCSTLSEQPGQPGQPEQTGQAGTDGRTNRTFEEPGFLQRAHRLSLRHCDISEWLHPRKRIEGQDSTIMEPPERPTHHHAGNVFSVSFSADGKLLTTGCRDKNAYMWDVSAILKEAGLEDLLLDQPSKLALATINATRRPVQSIKVSNRVPRGFFDDSPHPHRSVRPDPHDAPSQSVFQWARNIFSGRPSSAQIEPHKHGSAVPYAKGKRRNASAREKRRPALKMATASSSRPPNSNATQQSSGAAQAQSSSQPQAAASTSTAPPVVANTTSSTNPHVMIRHAGRWTRFWLLICCASSEYTDGHH